MTVGGWVGLVSSLKYGRYQHPAKLSEDGNVEEVSTEDGGATIKWSSTFKLD